MPKWILSRYSAKINGENGDLLLHNSFMGAVARIPSCILERISPFLENGIQEVDLNDPQINELVSQGFFVSSEIDEKKSVEGKLKSERDYSALNLIIIPHDNCNFRCVYCYESHKNQKMCWTVVQNIKKFIENTIGSYQKLSISWFGGEPLLTPDIIGDLGSFFLNLSQKKGIQYSASMSTNGYLLTPTMVDLLFKNRIIRFQITLDGPKDIHNFNRPLINGNPTYQTILDNLVEMGKRPDVFHIKIRVNFNYQTLPVLQDWLCNEIYPLFGNDSRFTVAFHPIGRWGGPQDSTINVCEPEKISQLKNLLTINSKNLGLSEKMIREYLSPHGNVCYASCASSWVIGSDGTVYKCTKDFENENNQVGVLTSDGIIFDAKKLNAWIEEKSSIYCESCSFFPCCQGRVCPLTSQQKKGPQCPFSASDYENLVNSLVYNSGQGPEIWDFPLGGGETM